jgi:hypothetical protein
MAVKQDIAVRVIDVLVDELGPHNQDTKRSLVECVANDDFESRVAIWLERSPACACICGACVVRC